MYKIINKIIIINIKTSFNETERRKEEKIYVKKIT